MIIVRQCQVHHMVSMTEAACLEVAAVAVAVAVAVATVFHDCDRRGSGNTAATATATVARCEQRPSHPGSGSGKPHSSRLLRNTYMGCI